ncbi:MAG: response regulator [Myxococcota bacterium]|nr:response regulator [Myxococcota bacterium]
MQKLLWIGHRQGPVQLKALLAEQGTDLLSFNSVTSALSATEGMEVAVAIITADWKEASAAVEQLARTRPEIQVLMATDAGIPRAVVLALWGGASGVLEFKNQTRNEIVQQIQEWVSRHRQAARERQLLLRLRALNEEFLKNIVAAQKRNMELEERLQPEMDRLAAEGDTPRILVCDDEEVVRSVLEAILSKKNYGFLSVENGEDALEAVRTGKQENKPFNLVISDKNLPGMSGLDLLKQVKAFSPETDFMLMTGYASMDSAIDALNSGAAAYLEKPFEHVKYVLDKIEGVLEIQRERNRKRHYLHQIKDRNRVFLEQYRAIRADLEAWLETRGGLPGATRAEQAATAKHSAVEDDKGPRPWND